MEIWKPTPDGLEMVESKVIYGRVSMLAKLRPLGATTDHLFIGTVRFQYFTVVWDPNTRQLNTAQEFTDVTEKYMQESHSVDRCLVDPNGRYLLLELFQGILSLVKILTKPRRGMPAGQYMEGPEQARITELRVRASTLLYTESNRPKLALLFEEAKGKLKLVTYRLVDEKGQFSEFNPEKDRENELEDLDMGASHLIPVPQGESEQRRYVVRNASAAKAQLGGVIIVGETKITYLDDESKAVVQYALDEASIFVAWESYDDLRYLLADDYGMLHLLEILVDGAIVTGIKVRKLGKISRATTMVHMGDGVVFIGSHIGDSQVIRLYLEAGDQAITVLQTMANIAPVLDFAVMDMGSREGEPHTNDYSSGQARLVTCSGAHEDGSLRSVRSGVGLEDIGILADLEDIRNLFSLRSSEDSTADDTLVVSFPTETRVFKFDSRGEVEEIDTFRGLSLDQHILLAMNIPGGLILQVTPTSVSIVGLGPSCVVGQWHPPTNQIITAASANYRHVLISVNGTTLVSLDIQQKLREVAVQTLGNGDQVACVHVPDDSSDIGVVGFFKSGSLSLLKLDDLQIIHSEDLRRTNNASIPRDIVLTQVLSKDRSGPSLFVAMEDGIVLTFSVDKSDYSLSGRKSIVLGTQQARFQVLPRENGLSNVFANCEHPSLIYGSEGSVVYSAVTAENAVCVCSFDGEAYPGSVIVATSEGIKISQIDTKRQTHVQTLPMGKTVRRISHSPNERAFAIGCIERGLVNGEETITSSFELVEEVLLGGLGKPYILEGSNGPELVECVVRAELPMAHGDELPAERFIVGTSFLDEDMAQESNVRGRILIFAIDSRRSPYLVHSHVLKGACRRVAILDGKIVAALVKTVVIYSYVETTEISAELTKLATYRTSTCPIDLDITGNIIAVADMMKSVSLLEYTPGKEGLPDKLVEIARHHEAVWSTAVTHIDEGTYLEADQDGNLLVLQRNPDGVTLEDRMALQLTGDINLGEMVNKIQRINVAPSPNALIVPKAFLATVSKSIHPPLPSHPPKNLLTNHPTPPRPKDPST